MQDRLPFNVEAEQGILGSILIDPEAIDQVADFLHTEDFYRDNHRLIYLAIRKLYEQRIPADYLTLCDELERTGNLEDIGGMSYIISLTDQVPTSGNVEYYARIVERSALCRRVIHACGIISALAYEQHPQVVQKAEELLFSLNTRVQATGFSSIGSIMSEYLQTLESVKRGTISGIPTGFTDLDMLTGGLQRTDLTILAARPSMGKTALGMGIACNAAALKFTVAVFSLEMGKRQLATRLLSMESHIDMTRLRNRWIEDEEWDPIMAAGGKLASLPIWINDACGNPISSMRSQLRRLACDQPIDLVIVDYLQLIGPEDSGEGKAHYTQNRVKEIDDITKGLKQIAREFDIPVLALAQLSRAVEQQQHKVPQLSHLRESGAIENDADLVMFIYRDDYYAQKESRPTERPGEADIIIAKHRNGPTGTVTLGFEARETRFYNLESELARRQNEY